MIVLADADLERAANAAAYYSMQNGGQTCISVERVYVEEPVYDEFVAKVDREGPRRCARATPAGPGAVDVGAITFPPQLDIVDAPRQGRASPRARRCSSAASSAEGARALLRADRARRRRPLDGVHDRGDLRPDAADHEGRATPTRRSAWPTTRPTASPASVWTKDLARGEEIARRVESGAVCVNDAHAQLRGARAADGRLEGLGPRARATAPAASASTARSSRCWSRGSRPRSDLHMFPYKARNDQDPRARRHRLPLRARQARLSRSPGPVSAGPGSLSWPRSSSPCSPR